MSKETYIPIETPIGIVHHRDAVYLDSLHYDGNTLFLEGECNGTLATNTDVEWLGYTLRFEGVLAFRVVELDSWFDHTDIWVPMQSSLWEVKDSEWQVQLGGKVTPSHRHFAVQTYDDVVDVICRDMEFVVRPTGS